MYHSCKDNFREQTNAISIFVCQTSLKDQWLGFVAPESILLFDFFRSLSVAFYFFFQSKKKQFGNWVNGLNDRLSLEILTIGPCNPYNWPMQSYLLHFRLKLFWLSKLTFCERYLTHGTTQSLTLRSSLSFGPRPKIK